MLKDKKQRLYISIKTALSAGTWIIASIMSLEDTDYYAIKYILPALMLCTLGDVLLAMSDEINIKLTEPYFTLGVASFGFAHIIFGLYFLNITEYAISWTVILSPATAILLGCLKQKGILKCGNYNWSIMIYALLVGAFLGLGINLTVSGTVTQKNVLLCCASMLFWISDLILSFRFFSKKAPYILGIVVFTTYFSATYIIAFSILL